MPSNKKKKINSVTEMIMVRNSSALIMHLVKIIDMQQFELK